MTTTARINWSTLDGRATVVPVLLVAGIPYVITPPGIHPTAVSIPGGTAIDPLWWPLSGNLEETIAGSPFDPVREWLALDATLTIETYQSARLVEGDVTVEALTLSLIDPDGAVTAELSVRDGRTARVLSGDIAANTLTIPINSGTGVPASGIAGIGREAIVYGSVSTNNLIVSSGQRGKFGSNARRHTATSINPPVVTFGGARHWQGRIASVWLCTLSDDGLTLGSPTCIYLGTVGAGVQLSRSMTRWSIPLDPVTETLLRRYPTRTIELWGINHHVPPDLTYIPALNAVYVAVDDDRAALSAEDEDGWHPDWPAALSTLNAIGVDAVGAIGPGGNLTFRVIGTHTDDRLTFAAPWHEPTQVQVTVSTGAQYTTATKAPDAFIRLADANWDGFANARVRIPNATDFASIPTQLAVSTTTGDFQGSARVALVVGTGEGRVVAQIMARNGTTQNVDVMPVGITAGQTAPSGALDRFTFTERMTATVGIVADGDTPLGALLHANDLISDLYGTDLEESAVDWDGILRAFAMIPLGSIPQARRYIFDGQDTLLGPLLQECRLRGMVLGMRYGRITAYPLAKYASTEPHRASIDEDDLVADDGGPIAPEIIDNVQPLATSMEFKLWDDSIIRYVDTTWQSEFGDTGKVECSALKWVPSEMARGELVTALYAIAQMILGPAAEPQRVIRLVLGAPFFDLTAGDLVRLTHFGIPSWTGVRGLTAATCQIQDVRHTLYGGRARVEVSMRLQSADLAGYAPEALVAAGGLSSVSPVVTLDTGSGFGASCFAVDADIDGNARTAPSDGFAAGDEVVLSEYDAESPIADEAFTIVSVTDTTITLDGNPSATMAGKAVSYGVILRYAPWTTPLATRQEAYAFIADAASQDLGSGDPPKRWA